MKQYSNIILSESNNKKKILRTDLINSICIAIMISINYILAMIGIDGGIVGVLSIILFLQIFTKVTMQFPIRFLILIFVLILFFLISILLANDPSYTIDYLLKFIAFGVISLYLITKEYKVDIIYKTILIIGFITIPLLHGLEYETLASGNKMGLTYSLLPVIFSAVIKFSDRVIYKIMSLSVIFSSTIILIEIASRGVIFSIALFGIIYWFNRKYRPTWKKVVMLVLVIILLLVVINNVWTILIWLQGRLHDNNISFYPLDKSILYYNQGKFFNNRDFIWSEAIKGIGNSPILGHGIGSFEEVYGTYVHNIFLQTMWEGGILFFFPIIFMFLKVSIELIKNNIKEKSTFLLFLFSLSFISLTFSSVLWMNQSLWILIGAILFGKHKKKVVA